MRVHVLGSAVFLSMLCICLCICFISGEESTGEDRQSSGESSIVIKGEGTYHIYEFDDKLTIVNNSSVSIGKGGKECSLLDKTKYVAVFKDGMNRPVFVNIQGKTPMPEFSNWDGLEATQIKTIKMDGKHSFVFQLDSNAHLAKLLAIVNKEKTGGATINANGKLENISTSSIKKSLIEIPSTIQCEDSYYFISNVESKVDETENFFCKFNGKNAKLQFCGPIVVDNNAFNNMQSSYDVVFDKPVHGIGSTIFSNHNNPSAVVNINFNEGICSRINSYAFKDALCIKKIELNLNEYCSVDSGIFSGCDFLTDITIGTKSDNGCTVTGLLDGYDTNLSKLTMKNIILDSKSLKTNEEAIENRQEGDGWRITVEYSDGFNKERCKQINGVISIGKSILAATLLKFDDVECPIDGLVYRLGFGLVGDSFVRGAQLVSLGTIGETRNIIDIPASVEYDGETYVVTEIGRNGDRGNGIIDNNYVGENGEKLSDPIPFKLRLNSDVTVNDDAFYYVRYYDSPSGERPTVLHTGLYEIENSQHIIKVGKNAFYSALISNFDFSNVSKIGDFAFHGCTNLTSVDLTSVKSIGIYAFVSSGICGNLTIPSGCEVGEYAFAATAISSVKVSGELGPYVFSNCKNLTSFEISGNSIPAGTFLGCVSLSDIDLEEKTSIGDRAFSGCTDLVIVDLSGVKQLGSEAFSGTGLTSLEVPSTIEFVGTDGGQFRGCSDLSEITFNMTIIPKECFSGCTNLVDFKLGVDGSRVIVIGEKAFEGTSVTSFTWDKVKEIGSDAFNNSGIAGSLDLSDIVFTKDSSGHFSDCSAITEVTLNQTSIPDSCFSGCTGLTKIQINGVESVGIAAFKGCSNIDSVNLDGIKSFGDYAFREAGIGGTINLSEANAIGIEAFAATNVAELDAPKLNTMGIGAFKECKNLKTITFGDALQIISQDAFKGCISLNNATFSNKVKIMSESFQGCIQFKISQTSLSFDPDVVLGWSSSAFKDSGSIKSEQIKSEQIDKTNGHYDYLIVNTNGTPRSFLLDVTIEGDIPKKDKFKQKLPDDLCGIYANVLEKRITAVSISNNDIYGTRDGALYEKGKGTLKLIKVPWYCEYLEIDDETTDIGKNAFNDTAITELSIPSKVKIIGGGAFKNNKSLVALHLEEGLERIEINAFVGCDIRSVTIPSTVTYIGPNAFKGNYNLDKVNFPYGSEAIEIGAEAFLDGQYAEIFLPPIKGTSTIFSSALKNVYISENLEISKIGKIFNSKSNIIFYVYAGIDVDKSLMAELGGCETGSFGDYYTIIDGSIHTYSYRSQEIDGHRIYFISEVGDLEVSDFKNSGTSASFGISAQGGYSYHDLELDVDGNTLQHKVGIYTIDVTEDIFVYVKERIPSKSYEVTFDSKGGSTVASLRIGEGRTLLDSQYPIPTKDSMEFIGWFITDSVEFTRDTPVNDNLRLTAHWASASPLVIFYADLGKVTASIDGKIISSGDRIPSGSTISFRYEGADCSEFVEWRILVNGKENEDPSKNLVINDVRSDVSVSVKERYHSASSILSSTITTDSPGFKEDLSMLWKTSFTVDTSMAQWMGHSSVPLIVDDHVYVRASDKIYKIEVDTGFVEKTVDSLSVIKYYHYLGYAHGLIIDYSNGNVYDTDLNYMKTFDFTVSSVFFDDGSTYLYGGNMLYKYDPSLSDYEWKRVLDRPIFGQWGTTSSVVVEGDYIYYINAVKDSDRTICSIRTDNGQSAGSITLDKIYGFNMDDGWLTCYDDTLYVTAYTVGLFNSKVDDKDEGYVISIPISKGSFGEPTYTPTASRANSQFVVYNDRGYVNAGFSLFVFDIDKNDRTKLTKAYSVFTGFSHGGIVLNTGDATEDNNHEVLVYVIPYNPGSGLVIARDHAGQESGDVVTKSVGTHQYNSQAVRSTSDGKLIWYTDTGNIYCIGTARLNDYYFFIEDSNGSMWYHATGSTAADALSSLGSDVVTLNPSKELATVGGKTPEGWKIWGLKPSGDAMPTSSSGYEWKSLNSLYDSAYNEIHYFAISKAAPSNGTDYVYADGDELKGYKFSWNIGDRSLIGKPMTQGSSENVVTIRFYDDGTEIEGTCLIGEKGSSLSGSFPSIYRSGWSGTWVDADGNPATFPTQFPSENTKYRIVWTQNSYTIAGEKKQVGSATYFEVSVTRASGEKDVAEPRLLLIAEYSNGVFTNVFSDALSFDSTGNASKSMDVGVSTENLLKVHVYLVSGKPLGAFESYGEYVCEVSS